HHQWERHEPCFRNILLSDGADYDGCAVGLVLDLILQLIRRQTSLKHPLIEEPVQVGEPILLSDRRLGEVLRGYSLKVGSRGKLVAMALDKVGHHRKERAIIAVGRVSHQKMKHPQYQRSLVVNKRLISVERLAGGQPVSKNKRPNVGEPSLSNPADCMWRFLQRSPQIS